MMSRNREKLRTGYMPGVDKATLMIRSDPCEN